MQHDRAGWRLHSREHGVHEDRYDAVVLAIPAPQAAVLLEPLLPLTARQTAVDMLPCWTVMLRYRTPGIRFAPGYDAAFVNHGPLGWIARDGSKPGRQGSEAWVLQATAAWSSTHLEDDEDQVTAALLAAFAQLGAPPPDAVTAHRWRYARAGEPPASQAHEPSDAGQDDQDGERSVPAMRREAVWLPAVRVGVCGDWLAGGRVEDAWLSGRALAAQVLTSMACAASS